MNKHFRIFLSLILCFAFICVMGGEPNAQAAPPKPTQHQDYSVVGDFMTGTASEMDRAETIAYWTPEAIASAKPMAVAPVKASDFKDMSNYKVTESPISKPGGMPEDQAALEKARKEFSDAKKAISERQSLQLPTFKMSDSITPFGSKNIFDGYYVNYYDPMWLYYPYETVGKLLFTDGANNYYCSASLISEYDIIVTAAHCVYNTDYDYFYYNWVFIPAAYGNWSTGIITPLGSYSWDNWLMWIQWVNAKKSSSAMNLDIALIHLSGSPSATAGWLGIMMNFPTNYVHHTLGYAENKYYGISSYMCVSESFPKKSGVLGMGCDMKNGSDGAPWMVGFAPYFTGWANGVVAGFDCCNSNIYGPRFTSNNFKPLCDYWDCW